MKKAWLQRHNTGEDIESISTNISEITTFNSMESPITIEKASPDNEIFEKSQKPTLKISQDNNTNEKPGNFLV